MNNCAAGIQRLTYLVSTSTSGFMRVCVIILVRWDGSQPRSLHNAMPVQMKNTSLGIGIGIPFWRDLRNSVVTKCCRGMEICKSWYVAVWVFGYVLLE